MLLHEKVLLKTLINLRWHNRFEIFSILTTFLYHCIKQIPLIETWKFKYVVLCVRVHRYYVFCYNLNLLIGLLTQPLQNLCLFSARAALIYLNAFLIDNLVNILLLTLNNIYIFGSRHSHNNYCCRKKYKLLKKLLLSLTLSVLLLSLTLSVLLLSQIQPRCFMRNYCVVSHHSKNSFSNAALSYCFNSLSKSTADIVLPHSAVVP